MKKGISDIYLAELEDHHAHEFLMGLTILSLSLWFIFSKFFIILDTFFYPKYPLLYTIMYISRFPET